MYGVHTEGGEGGGGHLYKLQQKQTSREGSTFKTLECGALLEKV